MDGLRLSKRVSDCPGLSTIEGPGIGLRLSEKAPDCPALSRIEGLGIGRLDVNVGVVEDEKEEE